MKTNDIGKVELFPFEITNLTTSMDTNIKMLEREAKNYPIIAHIIKFVKDDMNTFKRHCGIPVNGTATETQLRIESAYQEHLKG